ncbi:type I restriction endonuclease subunit R [Aquirufa antheringensis]|uniref:Type I restriction endonuclease subunit R n=1 Tax=Aquirufa antheringensis TaxID=2516559 RepID=A0A4Q9BI78_9BACT|nr:type I restriction endonuclease [Aquirufa antheringensis]MCZ2477683.1 type I restriction endonuclease subunit R [Aquirufa antheringensis]MCZ2485068.1 type I restriction endonuclease subunit R [Aquirufa antheringensis]TBH75373.1 type I restriction endonuclease subunit R [Aquirufa antheringensis]
MAKGIHTELTFEQAIEAFLLEQGGYVKGNSSDFDVKQGLFPLYITEFLKLSQPKAWAKIESIHKDEAEKKVILRLVKEIDLRGALDVIRKGFTDYGVKFQMAYFKPESSLNPEAEEQYKTNHLSVTRQLYYERDGKNSLDMVLSLNGLPIATIELKNQFSGQTVENAKKQYVYDRESGEPIFQFKKRALVHFAVDTDEAFMTTKLDGKKTRYLPFNLGYQNGAGNPPNPTGYRTSYLWEQVWARDSFIDIIGKFLHLSVEEFELNGVKKKKEAIIFPRFHQMQVVRKVTSDARLNGAGHNYLIQHSAGSGKSNSIAWLSYRLSSLHDDSNNRIFDSVIVITDRKVLDSQLQQTIFQFEHKDGVVQKIDKDSTQLATAISTGSNIIITTLQKFPFILDKIGEIPARKYAVIIDEAHSSQGGEATKKMKEVLSAKSLEDAEKDEAYTGLEEDAEDEIRKSMLARGKQTNLSFFAFTATPKPKTIEVFGTKSSNGKPQPFHLYSMKQAIEEGFILDVLKNYTTYKTYFKLSKEIEEDPKVNRKKAARAIGRFMSLHPHNLAQKTEVMVEHFRQIVAKKIGGKAKAMVVSSSRLHAVRYKEEFDKYIKEKGYQDVKTIVAFSGKVIYANAPEGVTEVELNGFAEKELPKKFASDGYQLLLVADKYQTGFDQPLLHTMYVDKKLSGVKAVQTLSRLNRMCAGKNDTFVLDFANETDEILESFQPYYELTSIQENSDPNYLYDLKAEIDKAQVIWESEVNNFCNLYFKSAKSLTVSDQGKLNAYIDPAVERFKQLPEENSEKNTVGTEVTQEDFKNTLQSFNRTYSFLTQIMPFSDVDLEKLFTYTRFLYKKLPRTAQNDKFKLGDEVSLEYYRLQKIADHSIVMESQSVYELRGGGDAGIRLSKEDEANLSEIIEVLNKKFQTEFNTADKLFFDQIEEDMVLDQKLIEQAKNNPIENFKFGFDDVFMDILISRMEQNQDIFGKMMDDKDFGGLVKGYMLKKVYQRLNA